LLDRKSYMIVYSSLFLCGVPTPTRIIFEIYMSMKKAIQFVCDVNVLQSAKSIISVIAYAKSI